MLRGLGRSPFGPRTPFGTGAGPGAAESASSPGETAPAAPPPMPPPSPQPMRKPDTGKPADAATEAYEVLKRHIHMQLVDRLDMNRVSEMDPKTLRNEIRGIVEHLCDTENPLLNRNERQRLVNEILDETFGFGPLELLLKDDKIGDIMINGPRKIFLEKEGRIVKSEVVFRDSEHLLQIIDRIVSRVGRRRGRDVADGRRPPPQRIAVQRHHPAPGAGRPGGHHPDVRLPAALQGRPAPLQGLHPRDARAHGRGDEGAAERGDLRRHGLRQDHPA